MVQSLRVLIVDGQQAEASYLRRSLNRCRHYAEVAHGEEEALSLMEYCPPDALLVDAELSFLRRFLPQARQMGPPVVIALAPPLDWQRPAMEALALGADAFLVRPVDLEVLIALMEAQLRRLRPSQPGRLALGGLVIDLVAASATTRWGTPLCLTRTEWALLRYLVSNRGRLLRHEELLARIWGPQYQGERHLLHDWMCRLRRKLTAAGLPPGAIETVPGLGYRLRDAISPDEEGAGEARGQKGHARLRSG